MRSLKIQVLREINNSFSPLVPEAQDFLLLLLFLSTYSSCRIKEKGTRTWKPQAVFSCEEMAR